MAVKGMEVKGTKITRVSFSSLNTIQHVIVEIASVPGNSMLREKGYIISDNNGDGVLSASHHKNGYDLYKP